MISREEVVVTDTSTYKQSIVTKSCLLLKRSVCLWATANGSQRSLSLSGFSILYKQKRKHGRDTKPTDIRRVNIGSYEYLLSRSVTLYVGASAQPQVQHGITMVASVSFYNKTVCCYVSVTGVTHLAL